MEPVIFPFVGMTSWLETKHDGLLIKVLLKDVYSSGASGVAVGRRVGIRLSRAAGSPAGNLSRDTKYGINLSPLDVSPGQT